MATGDQTNLLRPEVWDVSEFIGVAVYLQIEDNNTGIWGQISIDHITFSNSVSTPQEIQNLDLIDDFEGSAWDTQWTVTGNAFGTQPALESDRPSYMGEVQAIGEKYLNSFYGAGIPATPAIGNARTGTMTSSSFTVTQNYLHFYIAGGNKPNECRFRLLRASDNQELHTATGDQSNLLRHEYWDLSALSGEDVYLQIEDNHTGAWGQIAIDHIVLSDSSQEPNNGSGSGVDLIYNLSDDSQFQVHQFTESGTYTIISSSSGSQISRMQVLVKQADFANYPSPQDLISNQMTQVSYSISDVDPTLILQGGERLAISNGPIQNNGLLNLSLAPSDSGQARLLARLYDGGPVVGYHDFNMIEISDALQNDVTGSFPSSEYPGYFLVPAPLTISDLPPGGSLKISIFRSGVTFTDGSTTMTLTAADFVNGIYTLEFLFPIGMQGGYCHHIDVYDRYGNLLGRR